MKETNQWMSRKTSVAEGKVFYGRTSHNHDDEIYCAANECRDAVVTKDTTHQHERKPVVM